VSACKADAVTSWLTFHLVQAAGFEPAFSGSRNRRFRQTKLHLEERRISLFDVPAYSGKHQTCGAGWGTRTRTETSRVKVCSPSIWCIPQLLRGDSNSCPSPYERLVPAVERSIVAGLGIEPSSLKALGYEPSEQPLLDPRGLPGRIRAEVDGVQQAGRSPRRPTAPRGARGAPKAQCTCIVQFRKLVPYPLGHGEVVTLFSAHGGIRLELHEVQQAGRSAVRATVLAERAARNAVNPHNPGSLRAARSVALPGLRPASWTPSTPGRSQVPYPLDHVDSVPGEI
jgi:hypothetical protein